MILSVIFARTAIDSASPDFGSGSHVGGVGLVFVIAAIISVLGIGLMMLSRLRAPAYFLGATLRQHPTFAGMKLGRAPYHKAAPAKARRTPSNVGATRDQRPIDQPIICFSNTA